MKFDVNGLDTHFLLPNTLFASKEELMVKTILGSCVAVCLWDPTLKIGGVNHYLLPLWNGEGLETPKYGNIAITKLLDKMISLGCYECNIQAKIFGGASVLSSISNHNKFLNVGDRNIDIAKNILSSKNISIVSSDVGGVAGRLLYFNTKSGVVHIKKIVSKNS